MKRLLIILLFSVPLWGQCPATWNTAGSFAWCETTTNSGWVSDPNWIRMIFIPDTLGDGRSNVVFVPHDDFSGGATSPWGDSEITYQWQAQPPASSPYKQFSGGGDVTNLSGDNRGQTFTLKVAIAITGTPASIDACVTPQSTPGTCPGVALASPALPQTGRVWVDDEMFTYTRCDELAPTPATGSCPGGSTEVNFIVGARAQNALAGWGPAAAHPVGTWLAPAPSNPHYGTTFTVVPGADHWPARHEPSVLRYDPNRGRLWVSTGWQENYGMSDMWYVCIVDKSSTGYPGACGSTGFTLTIMNPDGTYKSGPGWQHVPLITQAVGNGQYEGQIATLTSKSSQVSQSDSVWDPFYDEWVVFGGLEGGGTINSMWIFCPSPSGRTVVPYACSSGGGIFNKWIKIGGQSAAQFVPGGGRLAGWANGGNPGIRNSPRGVFDPIDNVVLMYGGTQTNTVATSLTYNTVSVYFPATGDICISDKGVLNNGTNSSDCPSQFNTAATGAPPNTTGTFDNFFPNVTWDNSVGHAKRSGKMALIYNINGNIYFYTYSTNSWSGPFSFPNGPLLTNNSNGGFGGEGTSWVYDNAHDTYIDLLDNGSANVTTWQLPGGAIDGSTQQNTFTLAVLGSGTGAGTITETSPDTQISCTITGGTNSGACNGTFTAGSSITLSEAVTNGTFGGFTGCDSTTATTCTITSIAANRSVTATFNGTATFNLTETTSGTGTGTLANTPQGSPCGTGCQSYVSGTVVSVSETPGTNSHFSGYTGACTGTATPCSITMNSAQSLNAQFDLQSFPLTVTLLGNGTGSVTSNDGFINCVLTLGVQSGTCSHSYTSAPSVTLTSTPTVPSSFQGWGLDCTDGGTCILTMNQAHNASSTFVLPAVGTSLRKTVIR